MIDPRLERMVELNLWICVTANVGYDQGNRFSFPSYNFDTHSGDTQFAGETDCSADIYYCAHTAGFPIRYGGTMYTGTIVNDFKAMNWEVITWKSSFTKKDLKFGDVLYKSGHVAQWSGKYILEAYGDEKGGIRGGVAGDQANETRASEFRGGWELILRCPEVVEPHFWPVDPEEDMVEVDFVIEEGSNNIPNKFDIGNVYSYSYTKWASGKLDVIVSDYFNPVTSPKNYYGNPYAEKTLEFPSAVQFVEPPHVTGFEIKASSDLLNHQIFSLGTKSLKFWVWNVQTNSNKRWLTPRFCVDVKLEGYWK